LEVAGRRLPLVEHTMSLEDQGLPAEERSTQLQDVADMLLDQDPRSLWRPDP
jgi:hypothetical protein